MARFNVFYEYPKNVLETAEITVKYEGYLKQGLEIIERAKRLEERYCLRISTITRLQAYAWKRVKSSIVFDLSIWGKQAEFRG